MENPYFSKKFFVFHLSLCTAAPLLKKIDFFWGEGRLYKGYSTFHHKTNQSPHIFYKQLLTLQDVQIQVIANSWWTFWIWTRLTVAIYLLRNAEEGAGTPFYGLYGYVPRDRAGCLRCSILKSWLSLLQMFVKCLGWLWPATFTFCFLRHQTWHFVLI